MRRVIPIVALVAIAAWSSGCVWIVHRVDVSPLAAGTDSVVTKASVVKVHLRDGTTVMYHDGVTIAHDTLRGAGARYDRTLTSWTQVTLVPADSVAAIEVFDTRVSGGPTALYSGLTTAVVLGGIFYIVDTGPLGPIFNSRLIRPVHP